MVKIYIASMNMRGEWAPSPPNAIKINVTSAQSKSSKNRRDFSPMSPLGDDGYKGFWNFESYWQSGKVFEGIPEVVSKTWWRNLKEPKRRYPKSKGLRVLYSTWNDYGDEKMDYITSRKKVYIPEYYNLIKDREMVKFYQSQFIDGNHDLVVYDFDGPRTPTGGVMCLEVTPELLHEKINDPRHPFGHGYIVASLIGGIDILKFT